VELPAGGRLDGRLFGEAQSRAIVSCKPEKAAQVEAFAKKFAVPCRKIGQVGGDSLVIQNVLNAKIGRLAELFFTSIEKTMA